ncbi:MAG: MTH1187 family thiamine-binding protein [Desulfuromonadales bacterium]
MAVVEISVAPLGTGSLSVSRYVAACVEIVVASGLVYQLNPMGTVIEGDIDAIFAVLRKMHEVPFGKGAERVSTLIKIDDRRDQGGHGLQGKIDSVLSKLESGS